MDVHRIVSGSLNENCYMIAGPAGEALAIDPGGNAEPILTRLQEAELELCGVLITHAHSDHLAGAAELAERSGTPVHMHAADAPLLRRVNFYRHVLHGEAPICVPSIDVDLSPGGSLRFSDLRIGVLHTPGHTPGSVCFEVAGELFTGDTVLADGAGGDDLPESDRETLTASLALLARSFPAGTTVWPGHGEPTSLGEALSTISSTAV